MSDNYSRDGKGFRELLIWQRAHELTLEIYKLTSSFPAEEKYGLISQLRRASASVAANIVEGHAAGQGHFKRHLSIAKGSLAEVEYFLILAKDLRYATSDKMKRAEALRAKTGYLLYRFMQSMK